MSISSDCWAGCAPWAPYVPYRGSWIASIVKIPLIACREGVLTDRLAMLVREGILAKSRSPDDRRKEYYTLT